MAAPDSSLDRTLLKIKRLFCEDLMLAVEFGKLGKQLYTLLKAVRRILKQYVQDNEHIDIIIKILCKRSPNMTLALLSSRIWLKGYFGKVLAQNFPKKVMACIQMAQVLMEVLTNTLPPGNQNATTLLAIKDRWSFPAMLPQLASLPVLQDAAPEVKSAEAKAAKAVKRLQEKFEAEEGEVEAAEDPLDDMTAQWAHVFLLEWIRHCHCHLALAEPLVVDVPSVGHFLFSERTQFKI